MSWRNLRSPAAYIPLPVELPSPEKNTTQIILREFHPVQPVLSLSTVDCIMRSKVAVFDRLKVGGSGCRLYFNIPGTALTRKTGPRHCRWSLLPPSAGSCLTPLPLALTLCRPRPCQAPGVDEPYRLVASPYVLGILRLSPTASPVSRSVPLEEDVHTRPSNLPMFEIFDTTCTVVLGWNLHHPVTDWEVGGLIL